MSAVRLVGLELDARLARTDTTRPPFTRHQSRRALHRAAGALALAVACAVAAPGIAAVAPTSHTKAATASIIIGTTHRINSTVLGDVRELNVRLPAGYAEAKGPYPVLYLLDGGLDQDFHHIAALAQLGELSGAFGPFIVVGVQTKTRRAELTSPATDRRYRVAFPESGGADRFRRFLSEEVIPFIASHYRTGPRRAVLGESLAGLFVVDTLVRQPGLFQDYIAVSPSLWWDDRNGLRDLARRLDPTALNGRSLYLAMANEGGTMQSGADMLRHALEARARPGFEWRYSDRSATDTHATILHGAALDAMRRLYVAPVEHGPTPWFMIEGAEPPPTGSRR